MHISVLVLSSGHPSLRLTAYLTWNRRQPLNATRIVQQHSRHETIGKKQSRVRERCAHKYIKNTRLVSVQDWSCHFQGVLEIEIGLVISNAWWR